MKERERVPKPGGTDRTRPKPSTRPAPATKEPTTSRTRPAPGAPKPSSSSSKSSSSGTKPSTSGAKSSSSTSKSSSSTSKSSSSRAPASSSRAPASSSKAPASSSRAPASSSRAPASSSKSPATKSSTRSSSKPPSDSSRAPKAAASTSSSKSRSSSKPDEKPSASNARPPRPSNKDVRSNHTSSRRPGDSRSPSKADRESRRGEKPTSKSSSSGSSRTKDRERSKDEKRSDPKSKDRSSTSKSQRDTSVRKERDKGDSVKSSSRSKRSNDEDSTSAAKDRGKGDHVKSSSRSKHNNDDEPPSERGPKEHKEKPKERIKSSKSDRIKSSRTKERPAAEQIVPREEASEEQDSGVGVNLKGPVISPNGLGSDMDAVDQNQNSLETMESGISLSSPRDLSEVDVEESISSKMVEVDEEQEEDLDEEDEAMIDNEESFLDSHMEGKFSQDASMDMAGETNQTQGDDEDDDDYEEDFEDYESDFEDDDGDEDEDDDDEMDDDSVDSEAEDDSADEDTEEDSDVGETDPNMAEVLKALQEENEMKKRVQRTVVFDEPEVDEDPEPLPAQHEEPKIEPVLDTYPTVKPAEAPNQRPKTSRSFVNFAVAKQKQTAAQLSSKMSTRGQKLLNMIQLDTVTVELLTLAPVSYEAYISSFGHSNRQQVSIQTNEDALSEEVQTDEILKRDKWTQKPVHISIGKDEKLPGPEDYLGVGGDLDPVTFTESSSSNTGRLTSFLTSASQVMLALLEEELVWELEHTTKTNDVSTTSDGLGFSHPPIPMGSNVQSLLEGRPSPFVQFCESEPMMLLSGHGFRNVEEESEGEVKLNESSLICVWWVQEPSRPQHLLSSRSVPTSATFSPGRPSLVLAGLEDGSLAAWDLREPVTLHTLHTEIGEVMWKVRVPSFVTACNEVGDGEGSKIVSIQAVTNQDDMEMNNQGSFQVVTLSRDGRVTWWVVVRVPLVSAVGDILGGKKSGINITKSNSAVVSPHLGASPWSRIALNRSATISVATTLYGEEVLSDAILCHDLRLDLSDPSQLYVATGSGAVAHCSRHSSRMHPRAYLPEIEPGCEALCLAICPHDHRYILVGGSDGVVRLHSTALERPLTSWQSSPDCVPVVDLQWSPARPCVFYVLDANARLHIWDLSAGDIFPVLTVETGGLVGGVLSSFHIAPTKRTSHQPLHGVFANDQGELVLRQVSPEFCTHQVLEDYNTELERFTYYVNII
ncbi:cytoplasmic dynein 2 intermediate chain 1-like isoform X1 [Penaeus chinensis]|uniref:cytoplasmic dynein 2 intermediate chain 1-like isoform X1 n=1 Tax=Penaeus chinensis TaxID=139456 RepID=UPI001FB77C86|nr:cytoplasmic dynein 2 intermediate chain 1-like isoform X1 [Penaeus chinensis]